MVDITIITIGYLQFFTIYAIFVTVLEWKSLKRNLRLIRSIILAAHVDDEKVIT